MLFRSRIEAISSLATGYVYYVSLRGVTGAGHLNTSEVAERVALIRQKCKLPIGVGFGIRDGATARAIANISDAVIIGSRVIQEIEEAPEQAVSNVSKLLENIRAAMNRKAA